MSNTNLEENMTEVGTCVYHKSYTPNDYFGVVKKATSTEFHVDWYTVSSGYHIHTSVYGKEKRTPSNCILWGENKENTIFDFNKIESNLAPNLKEFLLNSKESKLIRKIRSLDTKWANSQIKKGNKPCGALLATVN